MCGRFIIGVDLPQMQEAFPGFEWPAAQDWTPRYNVAPTQAIPAVPNDGENKISYFHWGLIPFWAKDPKIGNRMINARSETLAEKNSFKTPYQRRRCLIPATGFYEWKKESSGAKTPMVIQMKGGAPFAFAGLWETWRDPESDEAIRSCTILTIEPNALVAPIHNRMPVILPRQAYAAWLDPLERKPAELDPYLQPYPADQMETYPVSTLVNNPNNDIPEAIAPLP